MVFASFTITGHGHTYLVLSPCFVQVFSCLEASLDAMAKAAGHHAYIFEAGHHNTRKLAQYVVALMAPSGTRHRRPQAQLPQPWDILAS